jgi:predicted RNA-binding protein YlqC (UPF0109 family)
MGEADRNNRVDDGIINAIRDVASFARHIVNNPGEVLVDIEQSGYTVLVALRTNAEDVGQVIGKNGYLITSIRSLLSAIGSKNHISIILDYVTEQDNKRDGNRADNHEKYSRRRKF